jgi:hypothetical protein
MDFAVGIILGLVVNHLVFPRHARVRTALIVTRNYFDKRLGCIPQADFSNVWSAQ